MTFNRYITLRMIVEIVGGITCTVQMLYEGTITGLVVTTVIALAWVVGQVWVVTILRRSHPRTDELSDDHQFRAYRFAFFVLIAVLMILGFVGMMMPFVMHRPFECSPMLLPALTMYALAVADARYLWLERGIDDGSDGDEE